MSEVSLFLPLYKVEENDDGSCTVYARGAQELADRTNEVFDYASSVPFIKQWSDSAFQRSNGLSYGNVRAMHGKQAAGKLTAPIVFNDVEKAIDLAIKVVDPVDAKKCREGVYTGMSIGGSYVRRWADPGSPGRIRYTANPVEFSLVDLPAIPTATFTMVKADGSTELCKFAVNATGDEPVNEELQDAKGGDFAPDADKVDEPMPVKTVTGEMKTVAGEPQAPNPMKNGVEDKKVQIDAVPNFQAPKGIDVKKFVEDTLAAHENELRETLSKQVGIGIKQTSSQRLREYADPVNLTYRIDTDVYVRSAVRQFNKGELRKQYDAREWNIIGRRIAQRATDFLGSSYQFSPKEQRIVGGSMNKDALSSVVGNLRGAAQSALDNVNDPEKVIAALHQIIAGIDVATDVDGLGAKPSQPTGASLAMAQGSSGIPATPPSSGSAHPAGTQTVAGGMAKTEPAATPTPKPEAAKADKPPSEPPPEASAPKSEPPKSEAPVEDSEMKKTLDALMAQVKQLSDIVNKVANQPAPKQLPMNGANPLSVPQAPEMTPLQKAMMAAGRGYQDGYSTEKVKDVLAAANGSGVAVQNEVMKLVQESLSSRGFNSGAVLRNLSPDAIRALRGKTE